MKTNYLWLFLTGVLLGLIVPPVAGQGTAFTYQGQLSSGGEPAEGVYHFQFAVYDAATGGAQQGATVAVEDVEVRNGVFSTGLDFGNVFTAGARRWLSISVRTNGAEVFTVLEPRQEITPTPYAITAGSVRPGAITGGMIASGAITSQKIAPGAVTGEHIDDAGERTYATRVQDLEALGVAQGVSFEKMKPMLSTSKDPVTMTLSLRSGLTAAVVAFSGEEGISELPVYVAQVVAAAGVDVDREIGGAGSIEIERNGRSTFFHGVVRAMTLSGGQPSGTERIYTVRLESPMAMLQQTEDYRVRTELSVPDVVGELLSETGATLQLQGAYEVKDQLIQYQETDFDFVCRLMEEEGIYYFMVHGPEGGELVVADTASAFPTIPGTTLRYNGNDPSVTAGPGVEYVTDFKKASRQTTRESVVATRSLAMPSTLRQGTATGSEGVGQEFEYLNSNASGGLAAAELTRLANVRQARNNLEGYLMAGESTSPDLHAGYRFDLVDGTAAGISDSYIVTRVRHAAFARMVNGGTVYHYVNDFEAIPAKLPFRPARVTAKPEALPCLATVVGPAGETRYVDQYGRVKVQFHWDRYGAGNEHSSAWVRVARQSGMMFIPEVGDEVLVSFLGGDPSAPVVIGSLYNGERVPPYSLPGSKNSDGIRSRSSDGAMNEVRFDGSAGAQKLSVNAARDLALGAGRQIEVNGPVIFNGGSSFGRIQAGQATAGPATSGSKTVKFEFPTAFARPPKVVITAEHAPGWNAADTFVATVKSVSTTSCTVNIVRVDQNGGWSMDLKLNWMAWE